MGSVRYNYREALIELELELAKKNISNRDKSVIKMAIRILKLVGEKYGILRDRPGI